MKRVISQALMAFLRSRITEQLNLAYAAEPSEEERRMVRQFRTKCTLDPW